MGRGQGQAAAQQAVLLAQGRRAGQTAGRYTPAAAAQRSRSAQAQPAREPASQPASQAARLTVGQILSRLAASSMRRWK